MIKHILLENFGPIAKADLDINDMTIICGKNSVGKTYLSYSYYMLSKLLGSKMRDSFALPTKFQESLSTVDFDSNAKYDFKFNVRDVDFALSRISEELSSEETVNYLCRELDITPKDNTSVSVKLEDSVIDGFDKFSYALDFDACASIKFSTEAGSLDVGIEVNVIEDSNGDTEELISDISIIFSVVFFSRFLRVDQYAVTSERTGISLFYSEADDSARKTLSSSLFNSMNMNLLNNKLYKKRSTGFYSEPIEDNISIIRRIKNAKSESHKWTRPYPDNIYSLMSDLRGGSYVTEKNKIYFNPAGTETLVPLNASSGASKSLLLLDYFVNMFEFGTEGTLVIDEPELNLHLDSQKKIAHVLCALVKRGIKVLVTTHSDHFVREVNNLIMLSNSSLNSDVKSSIMEKGGIIEASLLSHEQVSTVVISSESRETIPMPVSEYGIDLDIFNQQIVTSNDISSELFMEIYESKL
ncbi:AAA family ATPase [Vibrio rotiferianus]|uniref:AAA family ATPase n=1 Tax=Vibrio rotiferianus TaxID=190895 RepID=UPI00406A9927